MEKPARVRTEAELKDSILFWAIELRKAEKEALGAAEGARSAAKRKQHHMKMKLSEAVDVLLGKMP